jgi:hypothetical protein
VNIEEYRKLMSMRLAAGKLIDPETVEITFRHACMFDPYGDGLTLPEELQVVGREHYVRVPGAECWLWVHVRDLPQSSRDVILRRLGYGGSPDDDDIPF